MTGRADIVARLTGRVRDLFGIERAVFGAPMGAVAGPALTAAVSNAGGIGFLGHANLAPERVRDEIRETARLTGKPFGIGLLFPAGTPPREDAPAAPPPLPEFLRDLGPPDPGVSVVDQRTYDHERAHQRLDIAIAEGVQALSCGLGVPETVVRRAQAAGMRVISIVGSRKAAVAAAARGVDAIVAQGHEAGGHTGRTSTLVLVPQIVDAVDVPVIAAGGIVDGRTFAAALMLGAEGAWVGTSLLATPEAATAHCHKTAVVDMVDDDTVVSRTYTGKPSRVIRNRYTEAWSGHEHEVLPMPRQWEMVAPLVQPAKDRGSLEIGNWPTGQGAVLIGKTRPAADVVRDMVESAGQRLAGSGM